MGNANFDTLYRFSRALYFLIITLGVVMVTIQVIDDNPKTSITLVSMLTFAAIGWWLFRKKKLGIYINFMLVMLEAQTIITGISVHYEGFFNYNLIFFGFIAYFLNFLQGQTKMGLFWVVFSTIAFFFIGFNSYTHLVGTSIENPTLAFQLIPPILGFIFSGFTLYYFMRFFEFQETQLSDTQVEIDFLRNFQTTVANFTQTPVAIFNQQENRVTFTNKSFSKMLEYSEEELVGVDIGVFQPSKHNHKRTFEDGKLLDVPFIKRSGEVIYRDVEANPFEVNGTPYQVVFYHDNTIRKNAEKRLQKLIDVLPVSVTQTNKDGQIIYTNRYLEELTGFPVHTITSEADFIKKLIPDKEIRKEILTQRSLLLDEAQETNNNTVSTKIRLKTANGVSKFVETTMVLFSDFDLYVLQDVTREEEKKQELEQLVAERTNDLKASEEKLKTVINAIPDLMYYKDKTGQFLGCNQAFADYIGKKEGEIIGLTDVELLGRGEQDGTIQEIFEHGKTIEVEEKITFNNESIYLSTIKAPFHDANGELVGLVGISRDISAIKNAMEQEKKLNKMKSQFITMASHQFKTPLTAILASTELLDVYRGKAPENIAERIGRQVKRITTEVDRLNGLMNDILILGKVEAQKTKVKRENTDLRALCLQIIEDHFSQLKDGRSVIFKEYGDFRSIQVDPSLMSHVVSNLISNALKYSEGCPSPELHLQFLPQSVAISVIDFGIGIPEEEQEHLFEAFFRAKNASAFAGTGMGLVVAKEFIGLHNGTIEVNSVEGKGTTIRIEIPV